ncbi:MAG: YitT family protein [Aerococcaceae bacterium]|nr:YitT family protein [Aerococcaceae bacterium]
MKKDTLKSIILVTLGTLMFSLSVNMIIIPNHFGEGGVTGLTLLLHYVFGFDTAWTNFILNGVLLIIGWRFLERKTLYLTILSWVEMTLFLRCVHVWEFVPENIIVAAVASGVLAGVGLGLVVLGEGTTAGSDIVAMLMKKYLGISMPIGLLLIDIFIVTPLIFVIGLEKGVVTLLMVFILIKTMNFCLEGFNPRKSVTIISDEYEAIATAVAEKLDRGITVLKGYGYYSRNEKEVLYIVVTRNQLLPIQRIIHSIDPSAFVIITDVHQVLGEGFTFYLDEAETTTVSVS